MDSRKFGRYEIHGKLGRGAMGVVYKAFDPMLQRSLAIKVMSSGTDEEAVQRFFREARATAGLRHPNIVAVYDIGEEDHQPYIAIEYLDGQDLGQFLKQGLFVPFAWKIRLIIDICRGLHHAHEQGVIHRDIKPSNIRITRAGEVKIVDFGVAKLKSSEMTATGMVVGTPSYMSPQQVQGVKELDGRSDLFSAGVLLFELITGRKPFAAPELHAVMFQICNTPHPSLTEILPGCSEDLAAIVDRALAKDIEERFESGQEMARALEQFLKKLDGACKSLQQQFDAKAKQLGEKRDRLKEEGLADLVPQDLQQVPAPAFDPDQTILQDFGLFQAAGQQGADYGELLQRCAALSRQLEELDRAGKGFKEVRQLYAQSREQFESGLWEPCLSSLDAILKKQPEFAPALKLKKECHARLQQQKAEQEKKSRLDELLKQARSARKSDQLIEAQKLAQALVDLDPKHPEAASILEWVQESQQRQADLEECLAQARACSEKGDLEGCLQAALSGLEIAPEHSELVRLHKHSQQLLESQSKAEQLLEQARSHLEARQLEACLEAVQKGLQHVGDHPALQQIESQARSEMQRRQQVLKLFEEAQAQYQASQYSQVLKTVQSLLELDSAHQPAQQLFEQARRALDAQEQIQLLIGQARSQLEAKDADACLQTLRRGLELDGENEQLKALQQQAEAALEKRRQADQALAAARREAEASDYQSALKHLERALQLSPGWQEASQLQGELKAALVKQSRLKELLGQAQQREDSGDLQAALASAEEGLQLEPGDAALMELHDRIQQSLQLQKEIRALVGQAERQLQEKDYSSALESVQSLSALQEDHPRIKVLQQAAQQGLQEVEKGQQLLDRARSQAQQGDFEGCLQSALQGLKILPGHVPFEKLRDQAQQELEKGRSVAQGLKQAQRQLDKGGLQAALTHIDQVLKLDEGNREALQMQSQARQALDVQEQVRLLIDQARAQLEADDPQACFESVQQGLKLDGENEQLKELQQQAEAESEKRRQADQALAKARKEAQAERFQRALKHLERALELNPGWQEANELQDELQASLARQRRVQELLAQARRQEDSGDWQAALKSAEEGLLLESGHSELKRLQQRFQEGLERQKQVEKLAAASRKGLQESQAEEALKAAQQGLKLHPKHPELSRLAEQAQQAIELRRQIDELLLEAEAALRKAGGLQEAAALVERLEDLSPQQPEVLALRQRVGQQQAEPLLLKAQGFEESEELQKALETAAKALQLAPRHKELQQLHRRVHQRLEQIRQQQEREAKIRSGLLQAGLALEKGRLRAAQGALAPLLKLAPDLAEAQQLGKKVQVARQQRQAQLRKAGLGAAAALAVMLAGYLLWPTGSVDDPPAPAWISYQLQAGDTLQSAAARLGVDAGQLMSSNGLEGSDVFAGQVLQSSPLPADSGTLVLNISPWASIDALIGPDGIRVLEGGLTPLRIDLAPGEYTVQASNPELGGEGMEFKVTIQAGQVKREFHKWQHVDLERELKRLFLSRSAEGTN